MLCVTNGQTNRQIYGHRRRVKPPLSCRELYNGFYANYANYANYVVLLSPTQTVHLRPLEPYDEPMRHRTLLRAPQQNSPCVLQHKHEKTYPSPPDEIYALLRATRFITSRVMRRVIKQRLNASMHYSSCFDVCSNFVVYKSL